MAVNYGVLREVKVIQPVHTPWKQIVVNSGASISSLQDVKFPDSCGGYSYNDSDRPGSLVQNRFILWRTHGDLLEMEESSLDLVLSGARVCYQLRGTPIVGRVTITETQDHVVVLVITVASVHRLLFPHPLRQANRSAFNVAKHFSASIFYDASPETAVGGSNMCTLAPGSGVTSLLLTAGSCLSEDGEAVFAVSNSSGSVSIVRMPAIGAAGETTQYDLSRSSVIDKLWSGLVYGAIRGQQQSSHASVSLVLQSLWREVHLIALCRNLHLYVWSLKGRDCVVDCDLLRLAGDRPFDLGSSSGHAVKAVSGSSSQVFCVYLSLPDMCQFMFLELVRQDNEMTVKHFATLQRPAEDLVDFCVNSNQIIGLWTDTAGETVVRSAPLSKFVPAGEWTVLWMETPDPGELNIPANRDPRDFFLDRIFASNQFSPTEIFRALCAYRRSSDSGHTTDSFFMTVDLQGEVVNAVNYEIRASAADYELSEEDFYQLQLEQWGRFHSCCCQYREVESKLMGVHSDDQSGLVYIIRKSMLTYLRPGDILEHLYMGHYKILTPEFLDGVDFAVDGVSPYAICSDMQKLCQVVQIIHEELSDEAAMQFLLELEMGVSPRCVAQGLIDTIFFESGDVLSEIGAQVDVRLRSIHHVLPCLDLLQHMLDFHNRDLGMDSLAEESMCEDETFVSCDQHLFTGPQSAALMASTIHQLSHTRFSFLRDIIIVQTLMLRIQSRRRSGSEISHTVEQEVLPSFCNLLRSYYLLYWVSGVRVESVPTWAIDNNRRRLALLELTDPGEFNPKRPVTSTVNVLESFICAVGCSVAASTDDGAQASAKFMAMVYALMNLIWPMRDEMTFLEFLVGSCQYRTLQGVVRLLRPWCTWNDPAVLFFQALGYLHFDEPHKACTYFIHASESVSTDLFLCRRLLGSVICPHRRLLALYYLKVIGQLEDLDLTDLVISMAGKAIAVTEPGDPNVAVLLAKLFKHHLELNHDQDAFGAMVTNPDQSRRVDCLRQLVIVLSDRGNYQALVEFPYKDMESEAVSVLLRRARSSDLNSHGFYPLLYAFHVARNDLRSAATMMYECSMRLSRELSGVRSMQRQAQCHLVAMNALRLVSPEYAWIVEPDLLDTLDAVGCRHDDASRVKHGLDGSEKPSVCNERRVSLVELSQMEKEYVLLDARLRLVRLRADPSLTSSGTVGADEMVGILNNAGLYDVAVVVSRTFALSLHAVFKSLAMRCVDVTRCGLRLESDGRRLTESCAWLLENEVSPSLQSREDSVPDLAWKLLRTYLCRFGASDALYHRCVCETLLSQGFLLPTWLVNSYQMKAPAQLLRVYLDYDQVECAAVLLSGYLDALIGVMLGMDSLAFGLKGILHHKPMSLWVPYTCADQLMSYLQKHLSDHTYMQLHSMLQKKISLYERKVSELSLTMVLS